MTYLKDIVNEGGYFSGPLLVKSCEKGVANNGNDYLTVVFQDVTGSVSAKKWTVEDNDLSVIIPGKIVDVTGDIFKYKGHPQMKIESVSSTPSNKYDPNDFFLSCPIKDEELFKDVSDIIELIEDEDLKALTKSLLNRYSDKYMTYPAAVSVHHAYRCGIVYHSVSIAKDTIKICERYPSLNRDYLLAGALLHDLGKTKEMAGVIAPGYTFEGNLLGHISIGAMMVQEEGVKLGTPDDKLTILVHLILSHHGQAEYGSPVLPQTPEAYVLHVLDDLDAKMNIIENALKDVEVGEFSQKVPFLDMKAYLKTK